MLLSAFQSPTPPLKIITPSASATRVRIPAIYAIGIVRLGSLASSAAIAAPSIAKKNQIANGIAAKMPGSVAMLNVSEPAQPSLRKLAKVKAGATTPMNTSSSKIASRVTNSSKVAAICTPRMFRVMKIR